MINNTNQSNTQTENLELLRPYLDEELYRKCSENRTWAKYTASCLFSEIDDVYPINGNVTVNGLARVDKALKSKSSSLRELLADELKELADNYDVYKREKNTPGHKQKYAEYNEEFTRITKG